MKRFDERDTIFARMTYNPEDDHYQDYYEKNPGKKESDDLLRQPPHVYGEGTATFDPINSAIAEATFRFLGDIKKYSEGTVNTNKIEIDPQVMTNKLKGLGKFYGADLIGIAKLKEEYYYSHRGRNPQSYGEPIDNIHSYGIVFAVEMDREMINRAPLIGEGIEVTKGYVNAGLIGMILSYYLRELGYEARNHMDGNYLLIAPLVAAAAGLGEIGRSGLLITNEFGKRVRLGVVTTNMELIPNQPTDLGIAEFCELCGNCAITCPGKAISKEGQREIDGNLRWKIDAEACFSVWKRVGTDCGVCLAACPFSQGVSEELIKQMKDPRIREEILAEYKKKHGIRVFNSSSHQWL